MGTRFPPKQKHDYHSIPPKEKHDNHDNQLVNPMAKYPGHHPSLTLTKLSLESGIFTLRSFRSEKGARGLRTRQGETPRASGFLVAVHIFLLKSYPLVV